MRKYSKKTYIIAGAAVAALAIAGGGAAYAFWTNGGTGNGSATTGTTTNFTVTVGTVALADLSPGGPTDTVTYTIKNNDSGVEHMTSATPTVVDTTDAGCTAADFAISGNTFVAGDLAGGATSTTFSFGVQMIDTHVNQNPCKGVTVHLQVAAA